MVPIQKKFRINNPYKPDENVVQEVLIGDAPNYQYKDVPWVALDTEFINLNIPYSKLCVIQIASPDETAPSKQRIEVLWVWQKRQQKTPASDLIADLLRRKDLEMIMHVSTADLPRLEKFAQEKISCKLFDTKVAGRIVLTTTNDHSMANLVNSLIDPKFIKDKTQTGSQWDLEPESWDDKMTEYAFKDVLYLHPLKLALERLSQRREVDKILAETMRIMPAVCHLYSEGFTESILSY